MLEFVEIPSVVQGVASARPLDPNAESAETTDTLIWLHGLGADGNDFAPLFEELALPGLRVWLPHAPVRSVTQFGGMAARAWYDIVLGGPPGVRESMADVLASTAAIGALLDQARASGEAMTEGAATRRPGKLWLGGFSQGAAMALHVGLAASCPVRLSGILALSGYFIGRTVPTGLQGAPETDPNERSVRGPGAQPERSTPPWPPVLVAHGRYDGVVPFAWGQQVATSLQKVTETTWVPHDGGHSVPDLVVEAVRTFLQRR